jgi:hypothetical protein
MLNQNTAHARHPTTTPLRALETTDCKKHGCQLPLKLRSGLVSGRIQQTSHAEFNLVIRESALPEV